MNAHLLVSTESMDGHCKLTIILYLINIYDKMIFLCMKRISFTFLWDMFLYLKTEKEVIVMVNISQIIYLTRK